MEFIGTNKKGGNFQLASLVESLLQKLACLTFGVQTEALRSPLIIRYINYFLYIEQEVNYISVLYDIFFAFGSN